MKLFLLRMSCLILPLLILELSITVLKDPGGIESNRFLKIADILLSQQNARLNALPSQWGKFQESYIQERKKRGLPSFNIVTFGSSRSSEIRAAFFPEKSYHNCVIPSSNVLDYVSMYELYKKNNYMPQTVIINIDPWTFYERSMLLNAGQVYMVRDESKAIEVKDDLNNYLIGGMKELHQPVRGLAQKKSLKNDMYRYIEFLSPSYFQASLKVIAQSPVEATAENYIPNYFVIRQDGGYTLDVPSHQQMQVINNRALNFGKLSKGNFYADDCVESDNLKLLITLLDKLKQEHVHVVLFISPLHPSLYNTLEGKEKKLVEQKMNALAKEKGILLVGSNNPYLYHLEALADDPDFLDEYHISYKGLKTVFNSHKPEIEKYLSTPINCN